ncbi:MAG: SH3 domain-containing protein [Planctomycetota bacterium]|jgi:hypothetical protein
MNPVRGSGVTFLTGLLIGGLGAQEPTKTKAEESAKNAPSELVTELVKEPVNGMQQPGDPATPPAEASAGEDAAGLIQILYAQATEDDLELLCFPTELSPAFDDKLSRGEVVKVGEIDGDYRQVILPLGVVGYVHRKFVSQLDGGKLISTANKLAFRRRAVSGEAPVEFVAKGTEFLPLSEEGEWWRVRYPEGTAWLPKDKLQVFGEDEEIATLEAAYADMGKRHREEVDAAVAAVHQRLVEAAAKVAREKKLSELRTGFSAELSKPRDERDYETMKLELDQILSEIDEEDIMFVEASSLKASIEKDEFFRGVEEVIEEPEVKADVPTIVTPKISDPMRRFDATGWVHYDSGGLRGEPSLRLEKAGQLIIMLTCSSQRYNLRIFDGMEVGLNGQSYRADELAFRSMDVEKLEVLGGPPIR